MKFVGQFVIAIVMASLLVLSKSRAEDLVVPISIQGNNLYIAARVNGIPIRFILDTGASSLVLPAQYANMANLPVGKQTTTTLAGGSIVTAMTTVAREVGVGSATVYNVPAVIMSGGDPLLGQTVLQRFGSVTIDYQRRIVTFNYTGTPTPQTYPTELSLLGLSGRWSSSIHPLGSGLIQLTSVRVNPDRTMVGSVVFSGARCGNTGLFAGNFYDNAIVISMTVGRCGRIDVTLRLSENGWGGTYQSQFPDAGVIEMGR